MNSENETDRRLIEAERTQARLLALVDELERRARAAEVELARLRSGR